MRNTKQTVKIDGYPRPARNRIRREATVFETTPINRYGLGTLHADAAALLMRGFGLMPHFKFRSFLRQRLNPSQTLNHER